MNKLLIHFSLRLTLFTLLLAGCSQLNYLSSLKPTAYSFLSGFSYRENIIDKQLIDNIPFASSIISFGDNNKSLIT